MQWPFLIGCYKYKWPVGYEKGSCLVLCCRARGQHEGHRPSPPWWPREHRNPRGHRDIPSFHPAVRMPGLCTPCRWPKPARTQIVVEHQIGFPGGFPGGVRLSNPSLGSRRAATRACHGSLGSAELHKPDESLVLSRSSAVQRPGDRLPPVPVSPLLPAGPTPLPQPQMCQHPTGMCSSVSE